MQLLLALEAVGFVVLRTHKLAKGLVETDDNCKGQKPTCRRSLYTDPNPPQLLLREVPGIPQTVRLELIGKQKCC